MVRRRESGLASLYPETNDEYMSYTDVRVTMARIDHPAIRSSLASRALISQVRCEYDWRDVQVTPSPLRREEPHPQSTTPD
jgi:hypothetical protein